MLGRATTVLLAAAMFIGICALRELRPSAADTDEVLFVLPVALLALRFGLRGGSVGALLSVGIVLGWAFDHGVELSAPAYISRGVAFVLLGTSSSSRY